MAAIGLKEARLERGWSQQETAARLGVTQAYLSMVENGRRRPSERLVRKLLQYVSVPATTLPLNPAMSTRVTGDVLRDELGALGYPGFSYVRKKPRHNPAELLLNALKESELDVRVVEGLPWLAAKYPDMDWEWLVPNAKVHDCQNRLGFVVTLGRQLAEKWCAFDRRTALARQEQRLEPSRLAREDTLCHDSLTQAERNWLRQNRPAEAARWNLLTDLAVEHLTNATP